MRFAKRFWCFGGGLEGGFAGGGIMNPNFGILKNGTIVVGYLTENQILNLEWYNLVQGIIWLVRNGNVCLFFYFC